MKTFRTIAMAVAFLLGMALSAQTKTVTITFDEDGIELYDVIRTQYQDLEVTWSNLYSNLIVTGDCGIFENYFDIGLNNQIIHYDTKPAEGLIQLASLSKTLSFELRRPSAPGDIYLELYDTTAGGALVHDFGRIGWDGPDWETFTYDGLYGRFDQIYIHCTNKFVMDDLRLEMVVGQCILSDNKCLETYNANECTTAGGTYQGDDTECTDWDDDDDGYTEKTGDCNDNNAAINPAATEIRDGIDNNCDGKVCFISSLR